MPEPGADASKQLVAARALGFVEDGMRLGLGSGTTAKVFVDLLAARVVDERLRVRCVPTSEATRRQAESLGLDMATLDDLPELDLTIDGTDEFDPSLQLIKGGGGALLREKIVAAASRAMVVIADGSKAVDRLGRFPLPVEVNRFGLATTTRLVGLAIEGLGMRGDLVLRRGADGEPTVTDGGHLLLDCHLGSIADPRALADRLVAVPGVVEHGLFLGMAQAVVTNRQGGTTVLERASPIRTIP